MKTRKVIEINVDNKNFFCIYDEEENHYTLYEKWWDTGWHRKKLFEAKDFVSVLEYLRIYAYNNNWGL